MGSGYLYNKSLTQIRSAKKRKGTDELRCTVRQFSDQTLQLDILFISETPQKKRICGGHTIDMCRLDTPHKRSSENKWQNYIDKDWLAARTALHNGTSREEQKQGTLPTTIRIAIICSVTVKFPYGHRCRLLKEMKQPGKGTDVPS